MKGKKALPFILLAVTIVSIAAATIVEEAKGSEVARHYFYGSLWFKLLWASVAISGAWLIWKKRLWRRTSVFALHVSFILILLGALLTSLTGRKGMLHLRQGIPENEFYSQGEARSRQFPFYVRLDSFEILYYPGTQAPRDYVSHLSIEGQTQKLSMNHIIRQQGYRLYQSSYDKDLQGSIISVNYDPWGTGLTYLGYALLGLSMMWVTVSHRKRLSMLLLLMGFGLTASAVPSISREKAAVLERE